MPGSLGSLVDVTIARFLWSSWNPKLLDSELLEDTQNSRGAGISKAEKAIIEGGTQSKY